MQLHKPGYDKELAELLQDQIQQEWTLAMCQLELHRQEHSSVLDGYVGHWKGSQSVLQALIV